MTPDALKAEAEVKAARIADAGKRIAEILEETGTQLIAQPRIIEGRIVAEVGLISK